MFGKDKVKGHNRIIKGKSGFKVARIRDFLRKKDDNRKRNIVIGSAAVIGAGGIALLLRKKGVKVNSLLKKSTKVTPKNATIAPKNVISSSGIDNIKPSISNNASSNNGFSKTDLEKYKKPVVEPRPIVNIKPKNTPTTLQTEKVVMIKKNFDPLPDPWDTPLVKPKMRRAKLLVKKPTSQNRLRRKDSIPDPWTTPIKNKNNNSSEMLVKPKSEEIKLLTTPLTSKLRDNLLRSKGTTAKERVISRLVDGYATLPLPMKVTLQMEKALTRPIRSSNIGRPPDTKGLKTILDNSNKTPIEQVISKAKRKVGDRLKRQAEEIKKKQLDDIIPSLSRRGLLGVDKVKKTLAEKDKLAEIATNALAEKKSPMGVALKKISDIAKDPEAERLGIQVRQEEWEKALATITTRRGAIKATSKGAGEAARSLAYSRIVKPKIIKTLMNEVKSGNLQATNPKGYAERLKRIHDNFDELMVKEGIDYKKLGRRDLGERVGRVMEPEIKDATQKAFDWATDTRTLTDVFYGNAQMAEAFKQAGITDRKAQFVTRMLLKLGGLG